MNKKNKDSVFIEAYRDFIRAEIVSPEARAVKKEILKEYRTGLNGWSVGLIFGLSLAVLGLLAFAFLTFQQRAKAQKEEEAAELFGKPNFVLSEPLGQNPVKIKRLTSRQGSVMVYQRSVQNSPVTVIWAFKGGSTT